MQRKLLLLLFLPVFAGGCVTHKLWSEKAMDEWNEPAGRPNLRLYHDVRCDDFLVVYDEYSNRHFTTKTRAFFLRQNLKPLDEYTRPQFVSPKLTRRLPHVQVFSSAPTNSPESFYAVMTNGENFTLYSDERSLGCYPLPSYNDGVGRMQRMAWTPLTATADLTIVGGVLALICWEGLGQSGAEYSFH